MSDIRIFIAMHKDVALPKPNALFSLLGLGGYRQQWDGPFYCDADGDSIAARNDHYSEMTGWYWIWKNVTDAEIVGLCHCRRFFSSSRYTHCTIIRNSIRNRFRKALMPFCRCANVVRQ